MTLPAHQGQIDMNQVNVELGHSGTTQLSLDDADVRTLFGISSGAISLDDGHGKSFISVASGIICAWPSTVATIPANWSRVSTLDSKFLRGSASGTNPGGTGGSATHTHTVTDHTHTQGGHTHTMTLASSASGSFADVEDGLTSTSNYRDHSHTGTSNSTTATNQNASVTLNTSSSNPSYYTVIWIQSDGTPSGFPPSSILFYNNNTPPSGWGNHAASAGRFLMGAATSADGGSTGGAATHTHTETATHNHTQDAHSHTGISGTTATPRACDGTADTNVVDYTHTHTVTSAAATATNQATSIGTVSTVNGEPPYKTLAHIENTSGSNSLLSNLIAVWTGTLVNIPTGWVLCDGTNSTPDLRTYFIKQGTIGTTSGNQGHAHTEAGHNHTQNAHSHAAADSDGPSGYHAVHAYHTTKIEMARYDNTHSTTLDSETGQNYTTQATIQTNSDTRPAYYDVAFIMRS